jgi:glycosyltransferase involved in cell wall biosynthesis
MTPHRFPFSLTVFFPAYNDAPSLPGLLAATFRVLRSHVDDFEVIVINDGSADDTAAVLRRAQTEYGARLRVITHPENLGYGGALNSGFRAAAKEFVFYTDGDGQYDVRDLPKLLALSGPDVGLVNGVKAKRHDPLHRIWIGKIYNQFARLMFGVSLQDIDCDFRLIRRATLERIHLTSTSGTICVELVKKIEMTGTRIVEVPVTHLPRLYGRSQFFRLKSLATTFTQLISLHWQLVVRPASRRTLRVVAGSRATRSPL